MGSELDDGFHTDGHAGMNGASDRPGLHAFAFQTGFWRVRHRKLRHRLANSNEWLDFDGTCHAWELLGGAGNVDDHVLDDPSGAYRATTVRCLAPADDKWSIWWFDGRSPVLGPAVQGTFHDGTGTFHGDDVLDGTAIRVRFIWSGITACEARWEQAFSADGGVNWETNWIMHFARAIHEPRPRTRVIASGIDGRS